MTQRFLSRPALTCALAVLPWVLPGCGESTTTTVPTNPPPAPTGPDGNPVPPPTAAGGNAPQK